MEFNEYNILITTSSEMFKQAMTVMLSAMLNCRKPCRFFIMEFDWTDEQKKRCFEFVSGYPGNHVEIINVDDGYFDAFKAFKNFHTTYYKLLAHMFIPETVERVLYVDVDIIFRKDIVNYYSMDFDDNFFIAANSIAEINAKVKNSEWDKIDKSRRCLRESTKSNPGILLINLKKFREENIDAAFYKKAISKMPDSNYWYDEGIINFLFWDRRKFVPAYKYQTMIRFVGVHKKIFSLSKEQRAEYNEDYSEDYNELEALSLIHFVVARTAGKPWSCYYDRKADAIIDENGHRANPEEEPFYKEWWNIAKQLPLMWYEEYLTEMHKHQLKKAVSNLENTKLRFSTNALNFFKDLSSDCLFGNYNFSHFINSLTGKKIGLLKSTDTTAKFLAQYAEKNNLNIFFATTKNALKALTDEEWAMCKQADVIINCCVHGMQQEERDGISDVMIWDIIKGAEQITNDDAPAITNDRIYIGDSILRQELQAALLEKSKLEVQNKLLKDTLKSLLD